VQTAARETEPDWSPFAVDYAHFTRSPELLRLLAEEQKGLCAYTGVGLDHRLAQRRPRNQRPARTDYWFTPHIEHVKSEQQCREELVARGGVVGRDPGEDISYSNMVAALMVSGTLDEHFGAAYRGTKPVPMPPTNPASATAFLYGENGEILGLSEPAQTTVANLKLDHPTLINWRTGAIRGFLPRGSQTPRADLETIIERVEDESTPILDEFSFVISQIARFYLSIAPPEE
jgi:hypothetical protein